MIKFNREANRMQGKVKSLGDELNVDTDCHIRWTEADLQSAQVAVYVMIGGGMLGAFAMRQPASFYIDTRVGKLPYSRKDIMQVIECIIAACHVLGKDAHNLPEPSLPGCWVF